MKNKNTLSTYQQLRGSGIDPWGCMLLAVIFFFCKPIFWVLDWVNKVRS